MKLFELKNMINKLPKEYNDFEIVNGEFKEIPKDEFGDEILYRIDKPIEVLYVDKKGSEICFLNKLPDNFIEHE